MIATFLIAYLIGELLGLLFVFACAEAKRFSHRRRAAVTRRRASRSTVMINNAKRSESSF